MLTERRLARSALPRTWVDGDTIIHDLDDPEVLDGAHLAGQFALSSPAGLNSATVT
jgi:hypothetical protein